MPSQDTTDKLASLMAKVKKKAGTEKVPFPYFEVGDFVPDWSGVSRSFTPSPNFRQTCY